MVPEGADLGLQHAEGAMHAVISLHAFIAHVTCHMSHVGIIVIHSTLGLRIGGNYLVVTYMVSVQGPSRLYDRPNPLAEGHPRM